MRKVKGWIFAVALLAGISMQSPTYAKTAHKHTSETNLLMINTYTHATNVGKQAFVTRRSITAYETKNDQPDYQNPVQIPKNTALTVQQKLAGNAGYIITVPGNPNKLFFQDTHDSLYSYKSIRNNAHEIDKLTRSSLKWSKKLTGNQRHAIRYYTGDGYEAINDALRGSEKKASKKIRSDVKNINSGIHQFKLSAPLTVFRGTSMFGLKKSLDDQGVKVGGEYSDMAYSSTTLKRMVALSFSKHVILKINVPRGYHGAYIDPISKNKGEKEYLMNGGTKMIVTRLQKGYTTMYATIAQKHSGSKTKVKHMTKQYKYWIVTLDLMK
ncbi:MAG: ADP-ribosyltransferase [Lentilactobacillus hilgardii]|uniref:ADP-ribosyltransferase n=1 Tax=Lentilactobacillus hilgardii TaxID=1588 RepID=UPI001CC1ED25|nr:ADP-ribosyltransferase [Lentilactobacillus hilgardii]MBZ2201795.1 ADP-ribosylating toxin [Lentilactobacillus hilgardii]MBZ2204712.1 ADP-ribosylating toxin [Lentilactobacillus hilgardii]